MSIKSEIKKIESVIGAHKKPIIYASIGSDGVIRCEGEFMDEDQFHERFSDDQYKIVIFEFGFPLEDLRGDDL